MFRLPKTSNQSTAKKSSNLVVNPVVSTPKHQGLCKFSHRKCNFLCLENYNYCLKHILEDKSAPYKPCPYLYTVSGKKCNRPAIRQERKDTWFCAEHNRKTQLQKQRASSRHAPPKTQETLFATLGHYVPLEAKESTSGKEESGNEETNGKKYVKAVNPFVDIDMSASAQVNQVLDYISESDSDVETAMLDNVWRAQDHESSDAESVDSQNEDPLKHAGTYTAEEVTIIIKDKMLRLQSLYIDQFRRLHHLLKEKRRKYLHALKKEKESFSSIHDQEKHTAREQKLYEKLKALNGYHKHYGVEAILHKKALEMRAKVTEGHQLRISHKGKCAFTEGGVKCGAKTLPVTKFCRKHILEDTQQVLFRSCGVMRDDHICKEPTLNVFENATCVYHTVLPPQPHGRLEKCDLKESQTSEANIIHTPQNLRDHSYGMVDSEELIIKDILKPVCVDSGKSQSVDALELSRTVNDILALTEEHSNSCETEQTSDNPSTVQDMETSCSETTTVGSSPIQSTKPIDPPITLSLNKSSEPIFDQSAMESSSETTTPNVNQSLGESKPKINVSNPVNKSPGEKMDVEEEREEHVLPTDNSSKPETSEDLVMVDMMSDVGVVEEVLETDQTVVESVEVVVSSEHDAGVDQVQVDTSAQTTSGLSQEEKKTEEGMQVNTEDKINPENG